MFGRFGWIEDEGKRIRKKLKEGGMRGDLKK